MQGYVGKHGVQSRDRRRDFPGSPVVKTLCFQCRGTGSIPGLGTKIPHAMLSGQKKKIKRQKEHGKCMAQSLDCVFHKKQLRTGKLNKSAGSGLERWYLVALGYLG